MIAGRTAKGGTGNTDINIQSGRVKAGSIPRTLHSSSDIPGETENRRFSGVNLYVENWDFVNKYFRFTDKEP